MCMEALYTRQVNFFSSVHMRGVISNARTTSTSTP